MLITESQQYGYIGGSSNGFALLNNMNYLSEAESFYSPAMVPIIESTRYQANLVKLEDLLAFGEANGIDDLGYCLAAVCESSGVDPRSIAFTVHEENILADPEVASLSAQIMNEGHRIAAIPMAYCPEAWAIDEAVTYALRYDSSYLADCLMNEDYMEFLREEEATSETKPAETPADTGTQPSPAPANKDGKEASGTGSGESEAKKAEGFFDKLKKKGNQSRAWLARMAIRLRDWAIRLNQNIKRAMDNDKKKEASMFQKAKNMVAKMIAWVSQKIGNLATNDKFKDTQMSGEGDFQSKGRKMKQWNATSKKYEEVDDNRTYADALKDYDFDLSK